MFKKAKYFIAVTGLLGLAISGCSKTDGDVTSPNANALRPTGTVQGVLTDRVTQQPIVNALVDIDGLTATTNSAGQYSIRNVQATCDGVEGSYNNCDSVTATIDMRNVTSPVNMAAAGTNFVTPRYPDFAYETVEIWYTSLNDTDGSQAGAGSGTNHDTPVIGLMMPMDIEVGKLAATITGVVAYNDWCGNATVLEGLAHQPVGAGWTVKLVSNGSNNAEGANGGTGNYGNIVGSTTTDANGAFTFANIESMQNFTIIANNAANTYDGSESVTAPADGVTKILSIQQIDTVSEDNDTVLVCTTDGEAPEVIGVTPEHNSDLNPAGGVDVVFSFSEPIKADAYATALTEGASTDGGLYQDVCVTYDGTKAGNIAHTMSWSADRKTLTVNIPTLAAASWYTVDLDSNDGCGSVIGNLKDDSNLYLDGGPYTDVSFSTNGAVAAAAPVLTARNAASMDNLSSTQAPIIDWNATSGAKEYNVYHSVDEVWFDTAGVEVARNAGAFEFESNESVTIYTDSVAFSESWTFASFGNATQHNYYVKAVNADGTESAASNTITFKDSIGPVITGVSFADTDSTAGYDQITVTYDERLDEPATEATTWALFLGATEGTTVNSTAARLGFGNNTVVITIQNTLAAQLFNDANETLTPTTVRDLAGNAASASGDTWDVDASVAE